MLEARLETQQTQKLSQGMQLAIRLLALTMDDLSCEIQKAAQENPALEYVPAKKSAMDYAVHVRTRYRGKRVEFAGSDILAPRDTAREDLLQQLAICKPDEKTGWVASRMIHMLSPRGYFLQPVDEFAKEMGVAPGVALKALEVIQSLEPVGVGARNVRECLELQLRSQSGVDDMCITLVRYHLPDIGKGNVGLIAKALNVPLARVKKCVGVIRGLTPAPCSLYEDTVQYIMPEFSIEAGEGGRLSIIFHNDYYPTLRHEESFRRLAETLDGEEKAFARSMTAKANQLLRAIELRQTTMEKVARVIAREQHAFFLGKYDLLPLRVGETAGEVGVHETTVYRAIQNKYLDCDRGVFPLSHFFQREVAGGVSAARAKELIQKICKENGKLSDREIAETLQKMGVELSRRTVAKYRAQMDLGSSFRR